MFAKLCSSREIFFPGSRIVTATPPVASIDGKGFHQPFSPPERAMCLIEFHRSGYRKFSDLRFWDCLLVHGCCCYCYTLQSVVWREVGIREVRLDYGFRIRCRRCRCRTIVRMGEEEGVRCCRRSCQERVYSGSSRMEMELVIELNLSNLWMWYLRLLNRTSRWCDVYAFYSKFVIFLT